MPESFVVPEGFEGLLIFILVRDKAKLMEDGCEFRWQLAGTQQVLDQSIEAMNQSQRSTGMHW